MKKNKEKGKKEERERNNEIEGGGKKGRIREKGGGEGK